MRHITRQEMESLPSYRLIKPAINFPFSPGHKCKPYTKNTKNGLVTVAAIYNMSHWANWKSSSLGDRDRAIAYAIYDIPLHRLMEINEGRRMNQPALFPDGKELPMPKE